MLERLDYNAVMMRVAHLVAFGIDEARDDSLLEVYPSCTLDKIGSVSASIGSDQPELPLAHNPSEGGPHGS